MSKKVLDSIIRLLNESSCVDDTVSIIWHAGEPLAVGYKVFASTVDYLNARSRKYLRHSVQTNGTLINKDWIRIFKTRNILVGVSIDGAEGSNDFHRIDWGGSGTFERTMRGINELRESGLEFSTISVVTEKFLSRYQDNVNFLASLSPVSIGLSFEEIEGANRTSSISNNRSKIKELLEYVAVLHFNGKLKSREISRIEALIDSTDDPGPSWQLDPFTYTSIDAMGNVSLFSPELLGASFEGREFVYGNVASLRDFVELSENQTFIRDFLEISAGISKCRNECSYFQWCGGGEASNKLFENGSFDSTATLHCECKVKVPIKLFLGQP